MFNFFFLHLHSQWVDNGYMWWMVEAVNILLPKTIFCESLKNFIYCFSIFRFLKCNVDVFPFILFFIFSKNNY